jgi:hypothetical protein
VVPDVWIEQTTYRLQGGCSTAELIRQSVVCRRLAAILQEKGAPLC